MSEKWEDGNYVLYPAINHEQSLTDELLKSRQSPEALNARIAELEAENAMLKQLPQPIELWSDEKIQIYKSNESRSVKSGNEERAG